MTPLFRWRSCACRHFIELGYPPPFHIEPDVWAARRATVRIFARASDTKSISIRTQGGTSKDCNAPRSIQPVPARGGISDKEEVAVPQISACTPSGRSPQTERATANSNHFRPRSRSFHVAFLTSNTEGNTEFSTSVDENGPHRWKTLETYPQVWTKGVFKADGYHLPPRRVPSTGVSRAKPW